MTDLDVALALASLPEDTKVSVMVGSGHLTMGQLRAAFVHQPKGILTTVDSAKIFGYSSDTWAKWASDGLIEGAYQDGPRGIWRLPYEGVEARIERVRADKAKRKVGRRRGPWREETATPSTPLAGPEGVPREGITVLQGRSETLGWEADGDARPALQGVAGSR